MSQYRRVALILGAWLATCSVATAETLRVPADYTTVNGALDQAAFGDTVLVAPGTYAESEVRVVDFYGPISFRSCAHLKDGVALIGEEGPLATTLDMAGLGADTGAAVALAVRLASDQTILDGFTLKGAATGGQGLQAFECGQVTIRNCVFQDFDGTSRGAAGGVHGTRTTLEVYDSMFLRCFGRSGGGLHAHESDLVAEGCHFEACGIGLYAYAATGANSLVVRACSFVSNTESALFKGLQLHSALIEECWFESNMSVGLATVVVANLPTTLRRCVFVNNASDGDSGALRWEPLSGAIQENTFWGNTSTNAGSRGSTLSISGGGNVDFSHNIIAGSSGAPALRVHTTNVADACNLFWNNLDGDVLGHELDESTVFAAPEFCDPDAGDYTVEGDSPCVTSEGCSQIGAFGEGCDPISVSRESWSDVKAKYRRMTEQERSK